MSADIFISFASQDHRVAMTLCQALETRGFRCWISSRDIQPGENFQVAIVRAIRQAKIMLLVFTANSNNSEEMNKELALASQSKLMVVPLRIEDVTPNEAFAYEFATRQWIDFFADWEHAIQQLAQRIENATREAGAAAEILASVALAPEPAARPEGAAPGLTARLKLGRKLPQPAAEPATFVDTDEPADLDEALASADVDAPPARRSRALIYVAVSVLVLILAGVGVIAPGLMRSSAKPAAPRVMTALLPAAPPAAVQRVSAAPPAADVAVAPANDTETAVAKAAPKKKKAKVVAPSDMDVPY